MRSIQRNILDARRWLCLFLVCAFVLCGIGGIHQRAQAIVGVDDALIGILIAGLAAVGITFVSTGAYNSLTEYVGSLLDQYAGSIGTTGQGLFSGVQTGANSIGQLLINNRFVRLISAFATWLKTKFSLVDNAETSVVTAGTTLDDMDIYQCPIEMTGPYGHVFMYVENGDPREVYIAGYIATSGGKSLMFFSKNKTAVIHKTVYNPNGTISSEASFSPNQHTAGSYGYRIEGNTGVNNLNISFYPYQDVIDALTADEQITSSGFGVDVNTGVINPPLDDTDYEDGDGAIIDVAAPWGMTYPDIVNKWIPKEWAPGMSGNPTMTYDAAPAIDDQVQSGPETAQVSSDAGDYAVPGLQSVFPFCIPFDIYNLLSALAADPVAPSFTWRFYVPRVCDETFTVDLSPFDTVAQVVRTVELLAFIVGLAMVTRERFLRG